MKTFKDIPLHTACINCGKCCGLIPVSVDEHEQILVYLKSHKEILRKVCKAQQKSMETCPFRDQESKRCMIYEIRPLICRLMGVCSLLTCKQGNSALIDPAPYMQGRKMENTLVLNFSDWSAIERDG